MLSRIKYYFHSAINHKNRSIATQKKQKASTGKAPYSYFFLLL